MYTRSGSEALPDRRNNRFMFCSRSTCPIYSIIFDLYRITVRYGIAAGRSGISQQCGITKCHYTGDTNSTIAIRMLEYGAFVDRNIFTLSAMQKSYQSKIAHGKFHILCGHFFCSTKIKWCHVENTEASNDVPINYYYYHYCHYM